MSVRRVVLTAALLCLLLSSPVWGAGNIPALERVFGQPPYAFAPGPEMLWDRPIAADWHRVYIGNPGEITVFDSQGNWVEAWPFSSELREVGDLIQDQPSGATSWPNSIAVSKWGLVYATDRSYSAVHIYANDGDFIGGWGGEGDQSDAPGSLIQDASAIAVDDTGRVRVLDSQAKPELDYFAANHIFVFAHPPGPFPDVPYWLWAKEAIAAVADAGIVSGYPDGRYQPGLLVSRDQMAVFVARVLAGGDESIPPGPSRPTLVDVPSSHWAYDYVEYCAARGIVQGIRPGFYAPRLGVDRGQMAAFLARALVGQDGVVPSGPPTASFDDVPTSFWAFNEIESLRQRGIVSGYPDELYHPEHAVTRDQMAAFIVRAFGLM
jgi:hypothetical protein